MSKEPLFVAISNQKGGVGKSALTVVLASYFHFEKDLNVAIIDCDSPQHSLVRMRERDKKAVTGSAYYQQLLVIGAACDGFLVPLPHTHKAVLGGIAVNDCHVQVFLEMEVAGKHYRKGRFSDPAFLVADCNE